MKRAVAGVLIGLTLSAGCGDEIPTGTNQPSASPPSQKPAVEFQGVSTPAPSPAPSSDSTHESDAVITGTVKDSSGKPIAGAVIYADSTVHYNTNIEASTDDDGRYRIEVPKDLVTNWRVIGWHRVEYNGRKYRFDLHPLNDAPVARTDSGVRDFVWKLPTSTPPTARPPQSPASNWK
jgi:hypothetical protein